MLAYMANSEQQVLVTDHFLKPGSEVEVDGEGGCYIKCFSRAIVREKDAAGGITVEFRDFVTEEEEEEPLTEHIHASRARAKVRPALPASASPSFTSASYKVGTPVDFWMEDMWWMGYVMEVVPEGIEVSRRDMDTNVPTAERIFPPYFSTWIFDHNHVRLGYEWNQLKGPSQVPCFKRRQPPKAHLKSLLGNEKAEELLESKTWLFHPCIPRHHSCAPSHGCIALETVPRHGFFIHIFQDVAAPFLHSKHGHL